MSWDAAAVVRGLVFDRLDYLDHLASEADVPSRAALAETEIGRMTEAWRALLSEHQPDARGRCRHCSRWRHPRAFPCATWTIVHHHLVSVPGEVDRMGRGGRGDRAYWPPLASTVPRRGPTLREART
jgi:hypothetical protein